MKCALLALRALPALLGLANAFDFTSWSSQSFADGERIPLMVNKVASDTTQLPYAYDGLPFVCPSTNERVGLNLGEILRGDRIAGSDYVIEMGSDVECATLCTRKVKSGDVERAVSLIRNSYVVEWLLDDLPGATSYVSVDKTHKYYASGFKLGSYENDVAYLNNHVTMIVRYRPLEQDPSRKQIVAFEVYPKSIAQEYAECRRKVKDGRKLALDPTKEEMEISYSYSVYFKEDLEITYANRWDLYFLNNNDSDKIHWLAIINSLVIISLLTVVVAIIMVRTLSRDIQSYNQDSHGEDDKDLPEDISGWKLLHGDVFRPPVHKGVLASLIGAGVQMFVMGLAVLGFATLGFLSPSHRGGFLSLALFLFVFAGVFSGYFSSRLYKSFKGVKWLKNALRTSMLVPGALLGFVFVINFFSWGKSSSSAIPFGTLVALISMWLLILVPLVIVGAWIGFRRPAIESPTRIKAIPRQIPMRPWYMSLEFSVAFGGLIEFAVILIELLFILKSVWQDKTGYYYMYSFLGLTYVIEMVTVVEISIVTTYVQLCAEDYNWWWRSFFVGSGAGVWIFLYSVWYYFARLTVSGFVSGLLFFSYSLIACAVYGLCTGTVAFLGSYWFVSRIYTAVKTD
ncbi:putative multispanning membrane protein [Myxozyma melibiosi]|uniref:Transmembrane 9 superfamily member n=1 Tax=Myxozyma melibiosi TaxID=54550 RepID=A0ABR1F865_9ASCO